MLENKKDHLKKLIQNALKEDVGEGDHSTLACIDIPLKGRALLKIKDHGILAGVDVAEYIFLLLEPVSVMKKMKNDGESMVPGEIAFEIEASVQTLLRAERLVLNCMQRMSGIATLTRQYCNKISKYNTQLLDTRKTTPNFRLLEKEAVRIGGGTNHRFGLFDMIMLKDNHIDFCGGITKAVNKAALYVQKLHQPLKIEVETRTIEDVREAVSTGKVDRIMLDNFSPEMIREALSLIPSNVETEASGNIDLDNIECYAATGVQFISSGAIIHQAKSLDLSLKAKINEKEKK